MKTINQSAARGSKVHRLGGFCLAAMVLAQMGLRGEDAAPAKAASAPEAKAPTKEPEPAAPEAESQSEPVNWVEFSTGGIIVEGDAGSFQRRHLVKDDPFGGVDDMHYETRMGKKGFFQIDGRGLFDNHDYNLKMELVRTGLGFLRGGYKEYRSWYDGDGGFFPQTGAWMSLWGDSLSMDRGEAWIEAGLTLPKWPAITFKYSRQFRDGKKDSTSWGYLHPYGAGPIRAISPAYLDIDEKRDIFQGDIKYTLGKTDLGVGLRYEVEDNSDARKTVQWPGESTQRYLTDREGIQVDLFSVNAHTETRLSPKVRFTTGYAFTTMNSDISGSRIYGNDFDAGYSRPLASALGFYNLAGGSELNDSLVNLNLMVTPFKSFSIVPSLRIENQDLNSVSSYIQTGGGKIKSDQAMSASSSRNLFEISERLEMRYTGVTNWVFYGRGDWTQGEGDLRENGEGGLGSPVLRYTEDQRFLQRYTVGANWYPLRRLNIDFQYYHKERDNDFDNKQDNTDNSSASFDRYPAYLRVQDLQMDDANIRITLRPLNQLTLVTRYDFQLSSVDTEPETASGLAKVQTSELETHVIGQNVTWVPWSRLYIQGGINYVWSKLDTPADQYTQAVMDSQNNYWDASATAGFILDNKTDLQAHYFYYRANNYEGTSDYIPYGAGAEEHGITFTVTRKLREHVRLTLKYGFFDYTDQSSGSHNDYQAHLVYSSLHYRF